MVVAVVDSSYEVSRMGRYRHGYKYCKRCQLYIKTPSIRCPICNSILRTKPRKRIGDDENNIKTINPPPEILEESSNVKVIIKRQEN
mgnify:CR=1 FL=1